MNIIKNFISKNWIIYAAVVVFLHIIGIVFLMIGEKNHPLLIGVAFLAYTLGLRHAFDVDHIAAIDNTIRKLVQQKKNAIGVGFFFSLGHSSVVFFMTILLAVSIQWAKKYLPQWQEMGSTIGTIVSGCFLLFIGILNTIIFLDIQKIFWGMRKKSYKEEVIEELLLNRGFIARFTGPLFKLINKSSHVYPIGFLFGLGFDTASEVALLAISAGAAKSNIPFVGLLSLPILFAAGMCLMDTADGIFMTNAYHWAFSTPIRKVYYNLTVTALSVIAALFIGMIELVQVIFKKLNFDGGSLKWLINLDLSSLGFMLVCIFLFSWGLSYLIWKVFHIEKRWNRSL